MADNIITPSITNGITITVMAIIGVTALFLVAQAFHWSIASFGPQG